MHSSHAVITHRPEKLTLRQIWNTPAKTLDELRKNYTLLAQLIRLELLAQFKKSYLGFSWFIITPLINIIIWVILHSAGLFTPGDVGIPYPLFIILSSTLWSFFMGFYHELSHTIKRDSGLYQANDFPPVILLAKGFFANVIQSLVPLVLVFIILVASGVPMHLTALMFPIIIIPLATLGIFIGSIGSLIRIVMPDLTNFVDKIFHLLMFVTPVVYSVNIQDPTLQKALKLNPLTYVFESARGVLFEGKLYEGWIYLVVFIASLLLAVYGVAVYRLSSRRILEKTTNN